MQSLLQQTGVSADTEPHMQHCANQLGSAVLGVGLWADGVPCNWDRSQSLECFSMFFPGWPKNFRQVRLPILVLQKRFVIQQQTFDDVCEVLKYSFGCLAAGVFPRTTPGGEAWHATDSKRRPWSGKPIGGKAVLCEVRGVWQTYSTLFRLGGWSSNNNCCWKCCANKAGMKQFTLDAPCRFRRLSHIQFLVRLHGMGLTVNPLFNCPFFSVNIFKIDLLHTMDLGCAADWIGNVFNYVLPPLRGSSAKE